MTGNLTDLCAYARSNYRPRHSPVETASQWPGEQRVRRHGALVGAVTLRIADPRPEPLSLIGVH